MRFIENTSATLACHLMGLNVCMTNMLDWVGSIYISLLLLKERVERGCLILIRPNLLLKMTLKFFDGAFENVKSSTEE